MYEESKKMLEDLEKDLLIEQNANIEKEKEIERKERELDGAERHWLAVEKETRRQIKEKIKNEIEDRMQLELRVKQELETETYSDSEQEIEFEGGSRQFSPSRRDGNTRQSMDADRKRPRLSNVSTMRMRQQVTHIRHLLTHILKVSHVSTLKTQTTDEADKYILKPYVSPFSGVQPTPKSEISFEVWKHEVLGLKAMKVYSDVSIV